MTLTPPEDGTFVLSPKQPGGGSPELRKQLKILKDFIEGFDFIRMTPNDAVVKSGMVTAPLVSGHASFELNARTTTRHSAPARQARPPCA